MPINSYSQRVLNLFRRVINSARVEAMMRRSNQAKTTDKAKENIEYIEAQHSLI